MPLKPQFGYSDCDVSWDNLLHLHLPDRLRGWRLELLQLTRCMPHLSAHEKSLPSYCFISRVPPLATYKTPFNHSSHPLAKSPPAKSPPQVLYFISELTLQCEGFNCCTVLHFTLLPICNAGKFFCKFLVLSNSYLFVSNFSHVGTFEKCGLNKYSNFVILTLLIT